MRDGVAVRVGAVDSVSQLIHEATWQCCAGTMTGAAELGLGVDKPSQRGRGEATGADLGGYERG